MTINNTTAFENNRNLFAQYTHVFRSIEDKNLIPCVEKLTKWLSSSRAYYDEAISEILSLLLTLQRTFRSHLGLGTTTGGDFNAHNHLDHPLSRPYIRLVAKLWDHRVAFHRTAHHIEIFNQIMQTAMDSNMRVATPSEDTQKANVTKPSGEAQAIEPPPHATTAPAPRKKKKKRAPTIDFDALVESDLSALISPTSRPPTPLAASSASQIASASLPAISTSSPQVPYAQAPTISQPRTLPQPAPALPRPGPVSSPAVAHTNAPALGQHVPSPQLRGTPPIPRPTPPLLTALQVRSPMATAFAPPFSSAKHVPSTAQMQPSTSSQRMPPPPTVPQHSVSPPIPGSGLRSPSIPQRPDYKAVLGRASSVPQTASGSSQAAPSSTAIDKATLPLHSKSEPPTSAPAVAPSPFANVIDLTQDGDVEMVVEPTPKTTAAPPQPINHVPRLADRLFVQPEKAPEPPQHDQMEVDVPPPPPPPPMPLFPKDPLGLLVTSLERKAQKSPGRFPSNVRFLRNQFGFKQSIRFSFQFDIQEEDFKKIQTWNGRRKAWTNPKEMLCYSLGCYRTADIPTEGSKDPANRISLAPCTWPESGCLSLDVLFNSERMEIPLAPPFETTPDNLVDVSPFIIQGMNEIRFSQRKDLSGYLFVLHSHTPTLAQCKLLQEQRQKDLEWQQFIDHVGRPISLDLGITKSSASE